jgi:thermostable 8-oxoguanine DNA glycosylase
MFLRLSRRLSKSNSAFTNMTEFRGFWYCELHEFLFQNLKFCVKSDKNIADITWSTLNGCWRHILYVCVWVCIH